MASRGAEAASSMGRILMHLGIGLRLRDDGKDKRDESWSKAEASSRGRAASGVRCCWLIEQGDSTPQKSSDHISQILDAEGERNY